MKWYKKQLVDEEGQSLVEFTLILVILLILVAGVLDIGRAFYSFVAIENGAGEGALFASIHPSWLTAEDALEGGAKNPAVENIIYRASHESPSGLIDWSQTTIGVITSTIQSGQPITVTVTYSYTIRTPFINRIVNGGMLPLQARATQVILNADD